MGSDSENKKSVERKKPMAVAPIAKPLAGKNLCKRTLSSSDEVSNRITFYSALILPTCLQGSFVIDKDGSFASGVFEFPGDLDVFGLKNGTFHYR